MEKKFLVQIGEFWVEKTEEQIKERFEKFIEDPLLYDMRFNVKCARCDNMYLVELRIQ